MLIGFLDICNIIKYFANREDIRTDEKQCRYLNVDHVLDRPILVNSNLSNLERNKIRTIEGIVTYERK